MHDNLWEGVDLKLQHAQFFLEDMAHALNPPERTQTSVAIESTGAIIDTRWQSSFYPRLDAFLAMARSVPEVVHACFGADIGSKEMKAWYDALPPDEQDRRKRFSDAFAGDRRGFGLLPLSVARNVSLHRSGITPVTVRIESRFGVMTHVGSPFQRLPVAESRPDSIGGGLPFFDTPLALRPLWSDFFIDGKPLFAECRGYLAEAVRLVKTARSVVQRVHGTDHLTSPP